MAKMFKSLLSVFLAVFMVVSLAAIPSSAISISKSSITLTKGYQTTLSVSGSVKPVTWSTGDKSIATVNSKGKVVGKKPGTTYVYAKIGATTLKCKVKVVAAKITASSSSVTMDKGATKTITMTVKGSHSGLTVGTTNKSVATASWAKPVKWDGDKVKLTITAKGKGTAKIKVYLKNYSSTCYKYIDVNVGGGSTGNNNANTNVDSGKMTILTNPQNSIDVAAGGKATLQVYSSNQNNLAYSVSDTSIASVSAASPNGNYRNLTITGIKNGTATLRLYDKTNTNTYYDVKINVSAGNYYELYTSAPVKQNASDKIITIQINSNTSYYMVVPSNYDPAYVNTLIGQKLNKYSYYEVYTAVPSRISSTDTYYEFYHSNSDYNYGIRYILLPKEYDTVKFNTAMAQYNNRYEYWKVYSVNPTKVNSWDFVETWLLTDPQTGKTTTRYLLVPANGYDAERIAQIKEDDLSKNVSYRYYVGYTAWPSVNSAIDKVITYRKDNTTKYMVVPKDDSGISKANDAIAKDTGIYEYNVIYSAQPTITGDEKVVSVQYGTTYYYVLLKGTDNAPDQNTAIRYANGVKDD